MLLIMGLVAKSAVGPLAALQEHGKRRQAAQQLQHIRDAVIAHVVAYGALPCPAISQPKSNIASLGHAVVPHHTKSGRICTVGDGWVDAYKLRIGGAVNVNGALLDPWGREYRYVVSQDSHASYGNPELPDWTTPGEATAVGVEHLVSSLVLCKARARGRCAASSVRSDQIAFIVFSTASDNSAKGLQQENLDRDNVYVSSDESIVNGAEYDDLMVWSSTADVSYWMLRMGWLP